MTDGRKKLSMWERRLETVTDPMKRAQRKSAMEFRRDISRNFDKEQSPYGKKWSPRKRVYRHGALKETLKMRKSWRVVVRGDEIIFKSTDPKSIFHQEGTRTPMDARPAAPNSQGMPDRYSKILKKNTVNEISRHFNRVTGI